MTEAPMTERIDLPAAGDGGAAVQPAKAVSPWRRLAGQFCESKLALAGLVMLVTIIVLAVAAPVIAPQDPYDLSEIRIDDGRLPPGSHRLAPPAEQGLVLPLDPAAPARVALELIGEVPLTMATATTTPNAAGTDIAVTLTVEPADALAQLQPVRVTGIPRGATLDVGEKHAFRNFWTVPAADLARFTVTDPDGFAGSLTLKFDAVGSERAKLMTYWLGTDGQGRDMLSAILYGLRTSLAVGVLSGVFALMIGMSMGLTAAYVGGRTETLIMRLVDLQLSFPAILVALMLLAILGRGVDKVILALIIVQWAYYARTARSAALVERRKEYMEAARCLALSSRRIIFRHLLPNCLPPVIVVGTVQVANAIALEATLSFLGIGLPVTEPSLGLLISNGFNYLLSGRYWISVYPGVALLLTIIAINLVGDQLRDILNPRLQR